MSDGLARALAIISRAGVWPVCWLAIAAVWMLLVDTISVAELSAGAIVALLGTIATQLARREGVARVQSPTRAIWRALPRQLMRVPFDFCLLARELGRALLGRHNRGRFHTVPLDGAHISRLQTRHAAIELLGSLSPNTIVLGVDDDVVIVHQLAARGDERSSIREMAS